MGNRHVSLQQLPAQQQQSTKDNKSTLQKPPTNDDTDSHPSSSLFGKAFKSNRVMNMGDDAHTTFAFAYDQSEESDLDSTISNTSMNNEASIKQVVSKSYVSPKVLLVAIFLIFRCLVLLSIADV